MNGLSQEQLELRDRITRSSTIWGVVGGAVVFLLAFWLLAGLGEAIRWGGAIVLGGAAGFFARQRLFSSGAGKARCAKCNKAFSVREVDRSEKFVSSEAKQTADKADKPSSAGPRKITTWIEETYAVTAIDECGHCHNRTERKWSTTREKDKKETVFTASPVGRATAREGARSAPPTTAPAAVTAGLAEGLAAGPGTKAVGAGRAAGLGRSTDGGGNTAGGPPAEASVAAPAEKAPAAPPQPRPVGTDRSSQRKN